MEKKKENSGKFYVTFTGVKSIKLKVGKKHFIELDLTNAVIQSLKVSKSEAKRIIFNNGIDMTISYEKDKRGKNIPYLRTVMST